MTKDHVVSRRVVLALLAGAFSSRRSSAQSQDPVFNALDHIEIYVSNSEKSRDFLVRLFGAGMKTRLPKRYQRLGSSYLAFETAPANNPGARMDHFSVSIKGLQMERLHEFLNQRGVAYRDYPSGRDTAVVDPDDIRMQLSPEDGWSLLTEPNFRSETLTFVEPPLFHPTRLDHILLNVTDVERAAAFYQKVLGPQTELRDGALWFKLGISQLGLMRVPTGQQKGVNRIGLLTSPFDRADILNRLQQMSIRAESAGTSSLMLRDPDGGLIHISQA